MANQQALVLEAIMSVKKALGREKDGIPDSDNEAPKATNRGNKLKRRAEFYHEGEMGGRMPLKRKIDHAGYSRYIIRRNPKRFDEEGFELLTDEEDEEADREAAEKNPYSGIHIEELLKPLTHAKNLQQHPALSLPYTTATLTTMVKETLEMVHKERRTLVDMKLLLEQLRGDQPWIPAGAMMRDDDLALFGTELQSDGLFKAPPLIPFDPVPLKTEERSAIPGGVESTGPLLTVNGDSAGPGAMELQAESEARPASIIEAVTNGTAGTGPSQDQEVAPKEEDVNMDDAISTVAQHNVEEEKQNAATVDVTRDAAESIEAAVGATTAAEELPSAQAKANAPGDASPAAEDAEAPNPELSKSSNPPTPSAISDAGDSPPARMQTRARTAANGTPALATLSHPNSPEPARDTSPPRTLHPLYLPVPESVPNRDLGLPAPEAEELRRLLAVYIQKQEEVCRSADRLYQGLLKAQRLRDTVWWWARAEEHRGEMSDGEDWVDREEWGLDEDLRKGDVIVEEGVEEPGKKTRGRRVAV